ncbi:MAG: hypothetical protein ACOC56_02875 [Atribacterota bacterium]
MNNKKSKNNKNDKNDKPHISTYSVKDRKKLKIKRYNHDGVEKIKVIDSKGVEHSFIYSENVKRINNLAHQKKANEEAIYNFFKDKDTKPVSHPEYYQNLHDKLDLSKRKDEKYRSNIKEFKNENRLIFTNKKKIHNFTHTYILVKVRIYFNGFYTIAKGRSDYIYNRHIEDTELMYLINQATMRAVAPYGSNIKFKLITWNYVYYQQKYVDFKTW